MNSRIIPKTNNVKSPASLQDLDAKRRQQEMVFIERFMPAMREEVARCLRQERPAMAAQISLKMKEEVEGVVVDFHRNNELIRDLLKERNRAQRKLADVTVMFTWPIAIVLMVLPIICFAMWVQISLQQQEIETLRTLLDHHHKK